MAEINLSARDIDLIGRVVDTEVPRSIARVNPSEYQRMVGAVVDTITNRLAAARYGATVEDVVNQPRAFSKITGPKKLDPYGSVAKAPKATFTAQNAVDSHIKGRIAGVPSIIGGALDYANPNFSDKKNLRGWVQPMIDAGAKMLGIGNAVHYHGLAPGNFPAPPTDVFGPQGFAPHRGPIGPMNVSSPMRPDEANAAGPKGLFSVTPSYAAPLGAVERGPALGPASLPPDRMMPSGQITGSLPEQTMPPDRPMPAGPVHSFTPEPFAGVLAPDRMMPSGPVRPAFLAPMSELPAQQPTFAPPAETISPVPGVPSLPSTEDVMSPVPGAPASPTVDPTGQFPDAPAAPSTWDKVKYSAKPVVKDAKLGMMLAGLPGAIAAPAIGLIGDKLGIGFSHLGQGFDNAVPSSQRFSTGAGLSGIMGALSGPKGAQGFSLSNPGMSVTSLGNGQSLRRSEKFGWTEVVGPDGQVQGIKYDHPEDKGIFGKISKSLNDRFGGGGSGYSPGASKAISEGRGGLY